MNYDYDYLDDETSIVGIVALCFLASGLRTGARFRRHHLELMLLELGGAVGFNADSDVDAAHVAAEPD